MVEHYFVAAWLTSDDKKVPREFYARKLDGGLYSAGMVLPVGTIAPRDRRDSRAAHVGRRSRRAREAREGLDLVVDYGSHRHRRAAFWLLKWLHGLVHNWGWAIVLLTIIIKSAFYPLNHASARSMAKMKVIAPKLKALRSSTRTTSSSSGQDDGDVPAEKINPLGGCLPILVQIRSSSRSTGCCSRRELRNAPWILWIKDLGAGPVFRAAGHLRDHRVPAGEASPTPISDPVQAKVMQIMPIAFSVMFIFFPSGLVLYWLSTLAADLPAVAHEPGAREGSGARRGKRR